MGFVGLEQVLTSFFFVFQEGAPVHKDGSFVKSLERTQTCEDRTRRTGRSLFGLIQPSLALFPYSPGSDLVFVGFQEIQPDIGAQLCSLFPLDDSVDVHGVARRIRHKRRTPSEPRPRGRAPLREPGRLANQLLVPLPPQRPLLLPQYHLLPTLDPG